MQQPAGWNRFCTFVRIETLKLFQCAHRWGAWGITEALNPIAFVQGAPCWGGGLTDRKPVRRETMSAVRGADNKRCTAIYLSFRKINNRSSNIGKKNLGFCVTANQTSLQLISLLFHFFLIKPEDNHPTLRFIWGQEGAEVGCWSEAQHGLTGETASPNPKTTPTPVTNNFAKCTE